MLNIVSLTGTDMEITGCKIQNAYIEISQYESFSYIDIFC